VLNLSHLFLAAVLQGVFLIFLLLFNRNGNRPGNRLLACLVGLLSVSLWNLNVSTMGLAKFWSVFDYYIWCTPFLWGPVLYLYVKTLTGQLLPSKKIILPHAAIALGLFFIQFPYAFLSSGEWLQASQLKVIRHTILLAFYVQIALYLFASIQALKAFNQSLKNKFSNLDRINLKWLKRLIFVLAALIAIDMLTTVPGVILEGSLPYLNAIMVAESITIYLIGYFSLSQKEVLFQSASSDVPTKYKNSPLNTELSQDLSHNLDAVMRDTKIFQKNDLRLSELAELAGLKPHYLSQVINEQYHVSFYEYVNRFRVEFAADALQRDSSSSIAEIAFESGFNNRASFNSYFKKQTGLTPSQFKRRNHEHNANPLKTNA